MKCCMAFYNPMSRCLFHIVPTRSVFDSARWEEVVRRMEFYWNDSSLEESRVWKSFLFFILFGEWDVFGCFVRNQTVCTLRNNQEKKGTISSLSKKCLSWRRKSGENMGESFALSSPHWSQTSLLRVLSASWVLHRDLYQILRIFRTQMAGRLNRILDPY